MGYAFSHDGAARIKLARAAAAGENFEMTPAGTRYRASFEELARLPDERIDLTLGAALIARDAYPALDVTAAARQIGELAAPLAEQGLEQLPAIEQAARLREHIYVELGFCGNHDDYYDPKNSLICDVLARRTGIPITLALVYVAIARRVGVDASGVGFPGHFLVRIERNARAGEAPGALLVDPFFDGKILAEDALLRLLRRIPGETELRPEHTAPASPRAILVRMLTNLKAVHFSRGDYAHALVVLDRILTLTPDAVAALKARAVLAARLGAVQVARADLTRALELEPDADDAASTRATLAKLERSRAPLN